MKNKLLDRQMLRELVREMIMRGVKDNDSALIVRQRQRGKKMAKRIQDQSQNATLQNKEKAMTRGEKKRRQKKKRSC